MGAFRIVPLLRDAVPGDLRIASRAYEGYGCVGIGGRPEEKGVKYLGYVPHGFVVAHAGGLLLGALRPGFSPG
jgi:hypothetical protein